MSILALDPSSSAIGWAIVDRSGDPTKRIASGVIHRPGTWPWSLRIRSMVDELRVEIFPRYREQITTAVVVEVPGTAQAGRKRASGAGTHRYAAGVGAVLGLCWYTFGGIPVVTVEAESWTRLGAGRGKRKDVRVRTLEAIDRTYLATADSGGDEADAIMLGCWWATANGLRPAAEIDLEIPASTVGSRRYTHASVDSGPVVKPARGAGRSSGSSEISDLFPRTRRSGRGPGSTGSR